ncbi:MAG: hypothetical protein M3R30_06590 [Candidatus Eremiobacteraeota bacterium]|nr:hypothetical protein [Candidatus Eremiobacteraeota bacterium]
MKRTFATLAIAAIAAGLMGPSGVGAADAAKAAASKDPCAAKASKFQRERCHKFNASAPGDEYFGKMKLSYLGINNTFRDEAISSGAYTVDQSIITKVNFADDALRAWMAKYPNDPDLARSFFLGIQTFKKIYTQQYQDKAWDYMHLIVQKFPDTFFGKQIKKDIAIGFTQHVLADALPCSTPIPPGVVVPSALPSLEPSPTPAPNRPKLSIIQQPCIQPTPTPSPTPIPTATPTLAPPLPANATPVPATAAPATPVPGPTATPVPGPTPTPTP